MNPARFTALVVACLALFNGCVTKVVVVEPTTTTELVTTTTPLRTASAETMRLRMSSETRARFRETRREYVFPNNYHSRWLTCNPSATLPEFNCALLGYLADEHLRNLVDSFERDWNFAQQACAGFDEGMTVSQFVDAEGGKLWRVHGFPYQAEDKADVIDKLILATLAVICPEHYSAYK